MTAARPQPATSRCEPIVLALDVGTTWIKAALVDAGGTHLTSSAEPMPIGLALDSGLLDADTLVRHIRSAIQRTIVRGQRPEACVLTSNMGSYVWRRRDTSSELVTLWSARQPDNSHDEHDYTITGQAHPTLADLLLHDAAVDDTPLPLRSWLVETLTGVRVCDYSDASVTGWFDITQARWRDDIRARIGRPPSMPPAVPPETVVGSVTRDGYTRLGVPAGIPVVVGAGDGPCASLGAGTLDAHEACLTLGTTGCVRVLCPQPVLDPSTRLPCIAVTTDLWAVSPAVNNIGLAVDWAVELLGYPNHETATMAAARVPPGAEGLLFVPYLAGERFPHWDPRLQAAFVGLRTHHTTAHLFRAVLEGATLSLRGVFSGLTAVGLRPTTIVANGGLARMNLFVAMIAGAVGHRIAITVGDSLLGAAIIAATGIGAYDSIAHAASAMAAPRTAGPMQVWGRLATAQQANLDRLTKLQLNALGATRPEIAR